MVETEQVDKTPIHRLGLVDPRCLFREGFAALCASTNEFRVVLLCDDVGEAIRRPHAGTVDIWLIGKWESADRTEPVNYSHGASALELLRRRLPDARCLLLGGRATRDTIIQARICGYDGYASACDSFENLLAILRGIIGTAIDERIANPTWYLQSATEQTSADPVRLLTNRELEVLTQIARGNSVKTCSEFLKIAPSTLENHKASIMKKLRVNKSIDLVRIAIRAGLVEA